MKIVVNLDVMMARRKMSLGELAQKVDITMANLSILKNNKARAIRFSTLEAICAALDCQPGDILEFVPERGWWYLLDRQEDREGSMFQRSSFNYTLAVYDSAAATLSYLEFDT